MVKPKAVKWGGPITTKLPQASYCGMRLCTQLRDTLPPQSQLAAKAGTSGLRQVTQKSPSAICLWENLYRIT